MSKVLVDRELLERIVNTNMADYAVIAYQHKEIRAILDQPAEAEGVVPVICYLRATPDGTPEWGEDCVCEDAVYPNYDGDESVSMPLVRQSDHLAALSAVTAERDRLLDEVTELDALRDRLSGLLSQAAIALRGPEPELTRYGYADIPLRVKTVIDERDQLRAEVERLRDAAGKAIAWLDAEQNGSGVGINRRIKLCRDAENSLRAAMAAKEA